MNIMEARELIREYVPKSVAVLHNRLAHRKNEVASVFMSDITKAMPDIFISASRKGAPDRSYSFIINRIGDRWWLNVKDESVVHFPSLREALIYLRLTGQLPQRKG